jgi:hypothetical protein
MELLPPPALCSWLMTSVSWLASLADRPRDDGSSGLVELLWVDALFVDAAPAVSLGLGLGLGLS